ncbi:MAG: DUF502 domain-containing protein [Pseudomonadales bacterium]
MLRRAGNFLLTVLLGGLLVILPIVLILQALNWLLHWLLDVFAPLTRFTDEVLGESGLPPEMLSVLAIVLLCFTVGLLVRTTLGQWLQRQIERWFLTHLPGYEMLRDLFASLKPGEKRSFSKPVLVDLGNDAARVYGFVTDQYREDQFAVFIPTSPSPLNGYVVQVPGARLEFLQCPAETVMQSVLGCGIGSGAVVQGGAYAPR